MQNRKKKKTYKFDLKKKKPTQKRRKRWKRRRSRIMEICISIMKLIQSMFPNSEQNDPNVNNDKNNEQRFDGRIDVNTFQDDQQRRDKIIVSQKKRSNDEEYDNNNKNINKSNRKFDNKENNNNNNNFDFFKRDDNNGNNKINNIDSFNPFEKKTSNNNPNNTSMVYGTDNNYLDTPMYPMKGKNDEDKKDVLDYVGKRSSRTRLNNDRTNHDNKFVKSSTGNNIENTLPRQIPQPISQRTYIQQSPTTNQNNMGMQPNVQNNGQKNFFGAYQYGGELFKACGIWPQNSIPVITNIVLPDNQNITLYSNISTTFNYKNDKFEFNPKDSNIYNQSTGVTLKFLTAEQLNFNHLVQSSNNAQGYGQGRASEPDKCINDFSQLNSKGKIDATKKEIQLENSPKYIFKIEKQQKCSENLQQALEKAGIEKAKLGQLNHDCYAIYAYEMKDGKVDENNKRLVYEGQIENGKLSGLGRLFLVKGNDDEEYYAGEFKNGTYDGKGFYQYSKHIYRKDTGDSYKGEFKNGEKHGKGVYNYSNGLSIAEEWANGVRISKGFKDHSTKSDMQADVFVFDFANTVSTGYNTKRYATVGRIVSKEVIKNNKNNYNAKEDFEALNEEHEENEAENENKWKKTIDNFIEQAKKSGSKVLKIVLNVHGSNGSYLWLNDNHWDGQSFEYLLDQINQTPELKDKNIEIINCSCHQSQKFLFEELQAYLGEMANYFSHGIPNHAPARIKLSKDIDKKIENLKESNNKAYELLKTSAICEKFRRMLHGTICNATRVIENIRKGNDLKDLYCKIFPATCCSFRISCAKTIYLNTYIDGNHKGGAYLAISSSFYNDEKSSIIDSLSDSTNIEPILNDFNNFFKDVIKNENQKYKDLHEKCQGKKGEELFNVVFDGFIEQQKNKIIEEKSIGEEDVKEVEKVFFEINPNEQKKIDKEMDTAIANDMKQINDDIQNVIKQHNELVEQLTRQIVDNKDKITQEVFEEKKKEILNLKQTILTKITNFLNNDSFSNITNFLEKYKNDGRINLPIKDDITREMRANMDKYRQDLEKKFNVTEQILDYVFKYKRVYKPNYITDFVKDFAKKHCENNQAEVIYSEDINPDDVHYTIKKRKDKDNPLSVSNQQILLEYKKFNKENGELENILDEMDKEKYDEQKQQFLERVKQHKGVQKKDNPKETEEYHSDRDIHNESLNMLEIKNRSKKLKNELLYGKEIMAKIGEDTKTVSMIESKEEKPMKNETNDINDKDNNNENKETTFGGQEIISAQTNQKISIPEFTESEIGVAKKNEDDVYTMFLGNSQGKDGKKQSLFFTYTEDKNYPFALTYIEEDKNGQKNYWTYNCNKNKTIALMNDGKLRIHDNQDYLRQLQLFPSEENKDKLKIDFQNVSRKCLEKIKEEQEKPINNYYDYDINKIMKEKIKEEKNLVYKITKSLESQQEQNPKQHKRSKSTDDFFIDQLKKPNDPENQEQERKQPSFWCYYSDGDKTIDIASVSGLTGEDFLTRLIMDTTTKKIFLIFRNSKGHNELVKLTYRKAGEKGKIIINRQNGYTYECKLHKDAQLLIESCLNNEEKENKKIENGEEIEIDAEKFEEIFEKKREEKEFKIKDWNFENKTLQFLHDDRVNMAVYLYNNKILWPYEEGSLEVTLTYQKKEGRKGKIIMKLNNKNISFPLDEEARKIIESCLGKEVGKENLEKGVEIDAKKFEKIFDKKREEKEFKIKDRNFENKTLQFLHDDGESMVVYLYNNQIFDPSGQEVTLTYQKKEGRKGKIIMNNNGQTITYPLDEKSQEIIESCLNEDEKKNLEEGVKIYAQKFEKIFDKKREEKEFKLGYFGSERQRSFLKKPTVVLEIGTDDDSDWARIKIKDKIVSVQDSVSVELNGVTLMYQKATEKGKGKIIVKHNDNLVSYPIDGEVQEVIEKYFFDEEDRKKLTQDKPIEIDIPKFRKNIIPLLSNKKNNEQLDEEKSLELSEAEYYEIPSNNHLQNVEGLKFSNNHGDDWFVLQNGAIFYYDEDTLDLVPVELKYKPGEIIIKYYDEVIHFSLKKETQEIIERCLVEEGGKEKLEKGEEINIDAGKFQKIFETKKEEKFAQKQENEITINNTPPIQASMADVIQLSNAELNKITQEMMNNMRNRNMQNLTMKQLITQKLMMDRKMEQLLIGQGTNNDNMKNTEMNEIEEKNNENDLFNKSNNPINNNTNISGESLSKTVITVL